MNFAAIDHFLTTYKPSNQCEGLPRFALEFGLFTLKQMRAILFAGLFFLAVFLVPKAGLLGIARYDLLLIIAVGIQGAMVALKLESLDEVKAITIFHLVGFVLEAFKTSPAIGSWSYPDPALTKIVGVPLFSGFMYAAVGSYIIQAWRLFDIRVRHYPPHRFAALIAIGIYLNFFTHHWIADLRWYLIAAALGLYARTTVLYRPVDRDRKMPLLLSFVLIGFFIWVAENLSTFMGIWHYPNQMGAWQMVDFSKWNSWTILVIMTFTITAGLKHLRGKIYIPE